LELPAAHERVSVQLADAGAVTLASPANVGRREHVPVARALTSFEWADMHEAPSSASIT
jgi:hypothetical protein